MVSLEKDFEKTVKTIGQKIKKQRLKAGLSQSDMEKFGFDIKNYQKLEYGKSCTLYTLFRLSRAFGCKIEQIVNES